eukprot:CAMPEP_0184861282 /NCGR_PEP_ID=MMETSP0580-20130426/5998_1 /TAXON_ID=1118495 /ORGANISM="Dactyliosolen fragilissimus" /LENGTH=529 /DNA_ID=CAMNT_0027358709 /DNA_START=46 /DNA_END=1635 /DNA_ORIENTATION=-
MSSNNVNDVKNKDNDKDNNETSMNIICNNNMSENNSKEEKDDDSSVKSTASISGSNNNDNSNNNDLIINEGFPVLNTFRPPTRNNKDSNTKKDSVENGNNDTDNEETLIPRYKFTSFASALSIDNDILLQDCKTVFTSREMEDGEAYSSGMTYFIPAVMEPRCALEALALQIFETHTEGLGLLPGKHFDVERSGAEWWTLVLDVKNAISDNNSKRNVSQCNNTDHHNKEDEDEEENDEVGMHFDADYGLEEQIPNFMVHPRIATVTYLSNIGAPTLVLEKQSPPPKDIEKKTLGGNIQNGWLSCPLMGKHIAFDGRLLHGAPATFFPNVYPLDQNDNNDPTIQTQSKKRKLENGATAAQGYNLQDSTQNESNNNDNNMNNKRITFMVNIWLNHCPIDAELLDDETCDILQTPWQNFRKKDTLTKPDPNYVAPFQWKIPNVTTPDKLSSPLELQPASKDKQSNEEEAGSEESIICNRKVTFHFESSMKSCHQIAQLVSNFEGKTGSLLFHNNALHLNVGEEVLDSDSDND